MQLYHCLLCEASFHIVATAPECLLDYQVPGQAWMNVNSHQSYKANFGINYIKNGFNTLNFTLNYINFDVIYTKEVL